VPTKIFTRLPYSAPIAFFRNHSGVILKGDIEKVPEFDGISWVFMGVNGDREVMR
jgi:hypothetical protein